MDIIFKNKATGLCDDNKDYVIILKSAKMENVEELKAEIEALKSDLEKEKKLSERNWGWLEDEQAKSKALELRLQTIKNIVEI